MIWYSSKKKSKKSLEYGLWAPPLFRTISSYWPLELLCLFSLKKQETSLENTYPKCYECVCMKGLEKSETCLLQYISYSFLLFESLLFFLFKTWMVMLWDIGDKYHCKILNKVKSSIRTLCSLILLMQSWWLQICFLYRDRNGRVYKQRSKITILKPLFISIPPLHPWEVPNIPFCCNFVS